MYPYGVLFVVPQNPPFIENHGESEIFDLLVRKGWEKGLEKGSLFH